MIDGLIQMMNPRDPVACTSQATGQNIQKVVGTLSENEEQVSIEAGEGLEYETDSSDDDSQ